MSDNLTEVHPELVSEWSKKNKIKPTEVSIGSHKKVIWRCEKGREWEAGVKSSTINKTGCPYCSHTKVLAEFGGTLRLRAGRVSRRVFRHERATVSFLTKQSLKKKSNA